MMGGRAVASRGMSMLKMANRKAFSQIRFMGGGGATGKLETPQGFAMVGEFLGFVCWMWVFHRARHDLPVVLGLRHPWEHAPDPFEVHDLSPESYSFEKQTSADLYDPFGEDAEDEEEEDDDDDEDED